MIGHFISGLSVVWRLLGWASLKLGLIKPNVNAQ